MLNLHLHLHRGHRKGGGGVIMLFADTGLIEEGHWRGDACMQYDTGLIVNVVCRLCRRAL